MGLRFVLRYRRIVGEPILSLRPIAHEGYAADQRPPTTPIEVDCVTAEAGLHKGADAQVRDRLGRRSVVPGISGKRARESVSIDNRCGDSKSKAAQWRRYVS